MNWFLLNSGKGDAAFNMALDEALLENAARLGKPVLRFYGWTESAASFGYFQKCADVERATHLRPLVRRPTGGGIVPHDADWTYSFVVPPGHAWHSLKAEESYRRIHDWLRLAFAELKIETELAPSAKKSPPIGSSRREEALTEKRKAESKKAETDQSLRTSAATGQCFIGHEKFDLLWHGKKIAGAAQRRNKLGLLIQGSVQPQFQKAEDRRQRAETIRTDWENAMREIGNAILKAEAREFHLDEALYRRAEALAAEKYSQVSHNQRR